MRLFRQVDQMKVNAERAHQLQQTRRRLLLSPLQQLPIGRVRCAQINSCMPDVLNSIKQLNPTLLAQNIAHQLAQKPYIVP